MNIIVKYAIFIHPKFLGHYDNPISGYYVGFNEKNKRFDFNQEFDQNKVRLYSTEDDALMEIQNEIFSRKIRMENKDDLALSVMRVFIITNS